MQEAIAPPLEAWGSFYVIAGSSAGALTGLQFVVLTLVAQSRRVSGGGESISAFGTPNVVHFCAALLVASILTVPWSALRPAGLAVAVVGALGVIYSAIVLGRALRQRVYEAVFEDWMWHTVLPALAYSTLLVAGAALGPKSANALFVIGAAVLLLVFVGIHNAWDTVTYVVMQEREAEMGSSGGAQARTSTEAPRAPATGPSPAPGPASAGESPVSRAGSGPGRE